MKVIRTLGRGALASSTTWAVFGLRFGMGTGSLSKLHYVGGFWSAVGDGDGELEQAPLRRRFLVCGSGWGRGA